MFKNGMNPTLTFLAAILAGGAIGLINGLLVTKAKIPADSSPRWAPCRFSAASPTEYRTGRVSVYFREEAVNSWVFKMGSSIGKVPVQIFIMLALFIIAGIALAKTQFGFHIYATGGSQKAARLVGINTDRTKIVCFVLTGALCALAGLISIAYLQSVPTTAGDGREMDVIAAVILGGAALSGGRGTMTWHVPRSDYHECG